MPLFLLLPLAPLLTLCSATNSELHSSSHWQTTLQASKYMWWYGVSGALIHLACVLIALHLRALVTLNIPVSVPSDVQRQRVV